MYNIYPHYPHICFMKATLQISERSYFSLILNNRSQYDNQSTVMNCCQGTFVVGGFRVGITDRMKVIKLRQHHTEQVLCIFLKQTYPIQSRGKRGVNTSLHCYFLNGRRGWVGWDCCWWW